MLAGLSSTDEALSSERSYVTKTLTSGFAAHLRHHPVRAFALALGLACTAGGFVSGAVHRLLHRPLWKGKMSTSVSALLRNPRTSRLAALLLLVYFAAEWIVSASWRGGFTYRWARSGELGIPYCGARGDLPCSSIWPLMNAGMILTGAAIIVIAASWRALKWVPNTATGALCVSGAGLIASGLVTERVDYAVHATLMNVFLAFGAAGCLLVAASSSARLPGSGRLLLGVAGAVASVAVLAYTGGLTGWLGPGGTERAAVYSILIGLFVAALRGAARIPDHSRTAGETVSGDSASGDRTSGDTATTRLFPWARSRRAALPAFLASTMAVSVLAAGCTTSTAAEPEPRVLFADDFDGPAGPVGAPWQPQVGAGGWGNDELQRYTDSTENVRLDGKGNLAITAHYRDGEITSGRVHTLGEYSLVNGLVAARISLPGGRGLHPAFWLLGDDIEKVGWPDAGEIDVIETLNDAGDFHTGVHAPQDSAERGQNLSASGPAPVPLSGQFRVYWMRKSPGRIETGIDDETLFAVTRADLADDARWVFDQPFHLLLNLAVGGDWPGPPDESTPNPSTMLIDWVKETEL